MTEGDGEAAMRAFVEAARSDPQLAEARFNLATALQKCGNLEAARSSYLRAIELDPGHAPSHFNLGSVCQYMKRWDEARDSYLAALRLRPDYAEAHCNLGVLHTNLGEYEEAKTRFDRILELQPECAEAHCNRGMLLLGEGDYAIGWPEYAWYSKCGTYYGSQLPQPLWDGSPLAGRTILIVCDHGLGDTIQFVRHLSWVRQQGAGRILLAAQRALHPLLAESGFGELISPDHFPKDFDVHIPTVMLPALYYAERHTIDGQTPYLRARDDLVERWREQLAPLGGFKIGICWQGSERFPLNNLRSVPLAEFAPLAERSAARLISLQQGDGREQLSQIADRFSVIDLGDEVDREHGAFMDTAAIIRNLDLVVTSDTSMAHVAGALGARVWVALALRRSGAGSGGERRAPGIRACNCFVNRRRAIGRGSWRKWPPNWTTGCPPHDSAVVAGSAAAYDPGSRMGTQRGGLTPPPLTNGQYQNRPASRLSCRPGRELAMRR